jgi:hypothetical protein
VSFHPRPLYLRAKSPRYPQDRLGGPESRGEEKNRIQAVQPVAIPTELSRLPKLKPNSVALVRERTIPTGRPPLVGEVVPTLADRECCVVRATNSHGR